MKNKLFLFVKLSILACLFSFSANAQLFNDDVDISGGWIMERIELKEYLFDSNELVSTTSMSAQEALENFRSPIRSNVIVAMQLKNDSIKLQTINKLIAVGACDNTDKNLLTIEIPVISTNAYSDNLDFYVGQFNVIRLSPDLVIENTYYYNNEKEESMTGVLVIYLKKELNEENLRDYFVPAPKDKL